MRLDLILDTLVWLDQYSLMKITTASALVAHEARRHPLSSAQTMYAVELKYRADPTDMTMDFGLLENRAITTEVRSLSINNEDEPREQHTYMNFPARFNLYEYTQTDWAEAFHQFGVHPMFTRARFHGLCRLTIAANMPDELDLNELTNLKVLCLTGGYNELAHVKFTKLARLEELRLGLMTMTADTADFVVQSRGLTEVVLFFVRVQGFIDAEPNRVFHNTHRLRRVHVKRAPFVVAECDVPRLEYYSWSAE